MGADCVLIPHNLVEHEVFRLAPDFLLLNYLRKHLEKFYKKVARAGIRIGVLDTEGALFERLEGALDGFATDQAVRSAVRCYCCWGPASAEVLIDRGLFEPEQIVVTGCPRMDFYHTSWRPAALDISSHARPYGDNLVLMNTTFAQGNPGLLSREANLAMLRDAWKLTDEDAQMRFDREVRNFREFAALASRLAARFPQATFVYRPHPFESIDAYRELLQPHANLHLLREGTVDGWILRAKAVIQSCCSTSVEAGMAGVPTMIPMWLPPFFTTDTFERISICCQSEEELNGALQQALRGQALRGDHEQDLQALLSDWYHKIDGNSAQRVATTIMKHVPRCRSMELVLRCGKHVFGYGDRLVGSPRWIKGRLKRLLDLPPDWSFHRWKAKSDPATLLARWDATPKRFDAEGVRRITKAVQQSETARRHGLDFDNQIRSAEVAGCYHHTYSSGRSVLIAPEATTARARAA